MSLESRLIDKLNAMDLNGIHIKRLAVSKDFLLTIGMRLDKYEIDFVAQGLEIKFLSVFESGALLEKETTGFAACQKRVKRLLIQVNTALEEVK